MLTHLRGGRNTHVDFGRFHVDIRQIATIYSKLRIIFTVKLSFLMP